MAIQLLSNGKVKSLLKTIAEIISVLNPFSGATENDNGSSGLVPAPLSADRTKFLRGDGTWQTVSGGTGGSISEFTGATSSSDGSSGLVPAPLIAEKDYFLKGDGTWGEIVIPTDYVTLGTSQVITGEKTFRGSKRIKFRQGSASDKLGFTLYDNNNRERAFLEYASQQLINDTPTLLLGNYSTNANQITYIGFRNFVNGSGISGAYNLLAPLVSDASVSFELSTTYTNFYMMLSWIY